MSSHAIPIFAVLFGLPGWAELIIVAFVGLLLFGKRLPDVARSIGQSIIEFKKGMAGVKDEIQSAAETPVSKPPTAAPPNAVPPNAVPQSTTPEALPDPKPAPAAETPKNQTIESTD